jgi:hypothetical protein
VSLLAFSHSSGVTVAEVAFLLFLIAGVWVAAAWIVPTSRWQQMRMIVAGMLPACGGLLLIIATHWGHLFS